MRVIRVKNASILAKICGREIDFEVRNNKDCRGFALIIDGKRWLECDVFPYSPIEGCPEGGGIKDGPKEALFKIRDVKSNGVL